jgi:hypothetical protein
MDVAFRFEWMLLPSAIGTWVCCRLRELEEVVLRDQDNAIAESGTVALLIDLSKQANAFFRCVTRSRVPSRVKFHSSEVAEKGRGTLSAS